MPLPGVYVNDFYIPGLCEDFSWSQWERQKQTTQQFGLLGATMLDGLRATRTFTCPMTIFGNYTTRAALESLIVQIEGTLGQVGGFSYVDPGGNTVRTYTNVELVDFVRQFDRWDFDLLWFVKANVVFRDLRPVDAPA